MKECQHVKSWPDNSVLPLLRVYSSAPPLFSPSRLTLLSALAFNSSQSHQWTAASINRPHTLSWQAYISAGNAAVTPPRLFINLKISKITPVFGIVAKNHLVWEWHCFVSLCSWNLHWIFGHSINNLLCYLCVQLTLNCEGVSRVLKSGEEAILSSRVCRKTLWNSNISGRLPNRLSIWGGERMDGKRGGKDR